MAIEFSGLLKLLLALACAKLRRMTREVAISNLSNSEGNSIDFAQREIIILQGLVDGLNWKEFDERFGIKRRVLKANRESIAARFSPTGHVGGIYRAIVEAIGQEKLDTSNLPQRYEGQLNELEIGFFAMMYKGKTASEVTEALGIKIREFPTYKNRICEKLGVGNFFAAIGCMARDNKGDDQL